VCAVRLARRTAERARRDISLDDTHLDELAPGVPDPALAYMRRHYGAQFRTALGAAVATLSPRERNLLRHAVLDELGIDQLAAIYHVHRSTIARQLKQARATLVAATRAQLRTLLDVGETELESIFRVLVSLTHVTVRDLLGHRRP
jgi:RNA polymerase sigma-70 factor (ECF subfamily)